MAVFLGIESVAHAHVVNYEANAFPESDGWERIAFQAIDRFLQGGWFVHFVDYANEIDAYRKPLADFAGVGAFFIEWRVESDAPASILDASGVPVALVAGGSTGGFYHTTITDSRVQLFRDTSIPLIFVDIEAGVAHVYRLELVGNASYCWYIDGRIVDSGDPQGSYPNPDSSIIWATRRQMYNSTTRWDYVRYGTIPQDATGDYDSDGVVTRDDFYFFHECLSNERPGINGGPENDSGPGCRFADFDSDGDTDLLDFADFQNRFAQSL